MIATCSCAAAVLLLLAAVAKCRDAAPTADLLGALAGARRPARATALRAARLLAVVEAGSATAILATGARAAAAVGAALFVAFLLVALRLVAARVPVSCGCFGRSSAPVGPVHVVLTASGAAVLLTATLTSDAGIGSVLRPGGTVAAVAAGQVVLLAALAQLCVTTLPALAASRRAARP